MVSRTEVKKNSNAGNISLEKMPGHWVLAKLGKRVLRPGGLYLTDQLLEGLNIEKDDHVVEFAPGLGMTARLVVKKEPASYIAIEKDEKAAQWVRRILQKPQYECHLADASDTGLKGGQATVVYGEAMLTMQTDQQKRKIMGEAHRLLRRGGRYAVHEIALTDEAQPSEIRRSIRQDLSTTIHHGVNPLTMKEWKDLFQEEGFQVEKIETAPMALLEVKRVIQDEGIWRSMMILLRLLVNPVARRRVSEMRAIFKKHDKSMQGFVMILKKVTRD